jgi:hypothetical protein
MIYADITTKYEENMLKLCETTNACALFTEMAAQVKLPFLATASYTSESMLYVIPCTQ